jgi:hypothetical protein
MVRVKDDCFEHPTHDLAASRFGQHADEVHLADHRGRPELVPNRIDERLAQFRRWRVAVLEQDERRNNFTMQVIGTAHNAAPATAECFRHALSTSMVPMRWPAILMISSARPPNQTYPSSSICAESPL